MTILYKPADQARRRASSAGLKVDHRETLICRPPGTVIGERNRRRSVQPLQMAMAGEEGIHQRVRQADDLDEGHQAGACDLPEWRLGKVFAPEDLPAGDGPAVGAETCGKLTDAAW